MIIFEPDTIGTLRDLYIGREVICNMIKERDGKKEKVNLYRGIIKDIDEKSLYEKFKDDESEKEKMIKITVIPNGKDKEEVFTQDCLDWVPIDLVLKEHIDTEQTIICSLTKMEKPYLKVKSAKFECPSCGTIMTVLQLEKKFREPKRCSCGRRGGFKVISKEVVEGQDIRVLQKDTEFDFKAYIEGKEKIDLLKKINDRNFVKLTGKIEGEYLKNMTRGDFVIYVDHIEENVEEKPAFLR